MTPDGMTRFHGTNERTSLENLEISVRCFYQLIRNFHDLQNQNRTQASR